MSIKTGLVYDQRSGELVGFLNQPVDELPTIEEDLATHVLVFYVVGINSKLAMSLGFFPTKGVTASMLYSLLWKAVGWLEGICGLKVSTVFFALIQQFFFNLLFTGNDFNIG
ncbi:MAG: hypothetical protein V2I33_18010 [Kangiellaceae bacterium]|jgi:hypothetical protein|nr:hypothetical protein [Kangiellaceae bacterium]